MLFLFFIACQDKGVGTCESPILDGPTHRFPLGETYFFPNSPCGDWESESITVLQGDDGYMRATPQSIGTYSFNNNGQTLEITVIDPDEIPFHNLNYLPSQSIAAEAGHTWVAQVYSPKVSHISPSGEVTEIPVGSWPVALGTHPNLSHVLVAHKGSDTLGWLNKNTHVLDDAVWVGDEPTNMIIDQDAKYAYVSLATESAVSVIDIASRTVINTLDALRDPMAMALSSDGHMLYVATQRSGMVDRYPFESDHRLEDEIDLVVIDTQSGRIAQRWTDLGGTINGLLIDETRNTLYLSSVDGNPPASLVDTEDPTFFHMLKAYNLEGDLIREVDLSRQTSSNGPAVTPHGMAFHNDRLWLAVEGSSVALALDPDTLSEIERIEFDGLPRSLASDGTDLFIHGNQSYDRHILGGSSIKIGTDPRPEQVRLGQQVFMSPGEGYGENYSCNSCHADGKGDGRIWKAGPFEVWESSKAFFWLEGTGPTGWGGYTSRIENFGYEGTASINLPITTEQASGLSAYLASIMAPPAANGQTERDGLLSEDALSGEEVFYGKGQCADCHPAPLYTTNATLMDGVSSNTRASIPSLVGAYRHAQYLKYGETKSFDTAVDHILEWQGIRLESQEKQDLMHYLNELTAREFFVLRPPMSTNAHGVDRPIQLILSEPVWDAETNLDKIELYDGSSPVPVDISTNGRHVNIVPIENLLPDHSYTLRVNRGLESWSEKVIFEAEEYQIHTAALPTLQLSGEYEWTVQVPAFTPTGFDMTTLLPISVRFEATPTPSGADITLQFNERLEYSRHAVMNGSTLNFPDVPFFVGASAADSTGIDAQFLDLDGDTVADQAIGRITLTGPGIWLEELLWDIKPAPPIGVCNPGPDGDVAVQISTSGGQLEIDWGNAGLLGLFVTTPGASIPLGPGQTVQNGTTYWALSTAEFPNGFYGPVTYGFSPTGSFDISEDNGGISGGLPIAEEDCLTIHVVTDDFEIGTYTHTFETAILTQ